MSKKIQFNMFTESIINVLLNKEILIPVYQREYTWNSEHVNSLIDDLEEKILDDSEHYFGVIAITNINKTVNNAKEKVISKIIDGQQRLTTSLILMTYLVRHAKNPEGNDKFAFSEEHHSIKFDHEMPNTTLKENISSLLNGHYYNMKGSFKDNYEIIKDRLNHLSPNNIQKMYESFRKNFIVAIIKYDIDPIDEMTVFENLNSKGSPLKAYDLIKNHIISMTEDQSAQENLKRYNEYIWNLTQSKFKDIAKSSSKKEEKIERFIELYLLFKMSSKYKKYSSYSIYKNFKVEFKNDISITDFDNYLFEIRKFFQLYLSIELKLGVGKNIWLRTLSTKDNHYPLVFYIFNKYCDYDKNNDIWKISDLATQYFKVMAEYVVKLMSVYGTGQSFTNMWKDVLKDLENNSTNPNEMRNKFLNGDYSSDKTPSEIKFEESLNMRPKQKWIPYALINILDYIAEKNNKSNEVIEFDEKTIEHILPQKAKIKDWPELDTMTPDDFEDVVNLIGNLVNFDKKANSKLGNKSFENKKRIYMDSHSILIEGKFFGLKSIKLKDDFSFQDIKIRTKKLSQAIIKEFKKV